VDHQVQQDLKVKKAQKVPEVHKVQSAHLDHSVIQENLVNRVSPVRMVYQV
jgi:hypothetical protein